MREYATILSDTAKVAIPSEIKKQPSNLQNQR